MPRVTTATPQVSVRLYKTIDREAIAQGVPVSTRYKGQAPYVDLTPLLGDGSNVTVSKSVRDPAGAFSITLPDRPYHGVTFSQERLPFASLESVYGIIEPMDMVEIRMWDGRGERPDPLPIKMRGFVSDVQRSQTMGNDGRPGRHVTISGQDYGKIWQMYQILYLRAYVEGDLLLSSFQFSELFGISVVNVLPAGEFVETVLNAVINAYLDALLPANFPLPRSIKMDSSVSEGFVNNSWQNMQGSVYDILKFHGDVGTWNELYIEDREDGVYCVYRPTPAVEVDSDPMAKRKVLSDAPDPVDVEIPWQDIASVSASRSDAGVANFFWVSNSKYDLIDDVFRKLHALGADDETVNLRDYPNVATRYYGARAMSAETQQGDLDTYTGQPKPPGREVRNDNMQEWIHKRRVQMVNLNKDNVVFERGSARIKGGPMRSPGEPMRAGDYGIFSVGELPWRAYVYTLQDEFRPFQSYTTTATFDRATGFAKRAAMEGGIESPWLAEQATKKGTQ